MKTKYVSQSHKEEKLSTALLLIARIHKAFVQIPSFL
jgi:hypothetical protein